MAAEAAGAEAAVSPAAASRAAVPAAAEAAAGKKPAAKQMKKYIIFDFDGTLVNTNNIITESWQATLEKYLGRRLPVREIEATFGEVLADSMEKLIPGADIREAIDYYRAYQDSHQKEGTVYVFDGVRELLETLRERGHVIGVGTSRTAYSLQKYMKALDIEDLVDEIVTMEDVSMHKPHPETVEAVLRKMAAHDDEECARGGWIPGHVRDLAIMIGDTKYDIGCANNAGVESVLVGWSHYVDEEAMAADGFEPTYRIGRPEELLELV